MIYPRGSTCLCLEVFNSHRWRYCFLVQAGSQRVRACCGLSPLEEAPHGRCNAARLHLRQLCAILAPCSAPTQWGCPECHAGLCKQDMTLKLQGCQSLLTNHRTLSWDICMILAWWSENAQPRHWLCRKLVQWRNGQQKVEISDSCQRISGCAESITRSKFLRLFAKSAALTRDVSRLQSTMQVTKPHLEGRQQLKVWTCLGC